MPSQKNRELLQDLTGRLSQCTIAIATGCSGIPVGTMNDLRARLKQEGIEYRVVKNTLTMLAGKATGKGSISQVLNGPTGMVFAYGDPVAATKVLDEYVRTRRIPLTIHGAVLDGRALSGEEVQRLAGLPERDVLLAQLVGQIQAPLSRLVATLNRPIQGLATVLQQHVEQAQGTAA